MSLALGAIYNNYLTTYAPKSITKYDSHKKSELRSIYNSIAKLNKESPWYLPITSKETQGYAVDIKENARELHNTLAELGVLNDDDTLIKKNAYSSNEDIVTASFIGEESEASTNPSFDIEVSHLASPQENMGDFLEDEVISLPAGNYSFDVNINDASYEFQFSISEGEKNLDVQERLQRLINNSNIGLNAKIEGHEGQTSLIIRSNQTGATETGKPIFTISDENTTKQKGAVSYFGLDYISKKPTSASFKLNGEEKSSLSNHFTVGKMFELTLNSISDDSVKVGLKDDVESFADNVTNMIGGYNSFVKAASNYLESQKRSQNLINEMAGIANVYSEPMNDAGLYLMSDGTLQVDRNTLVNAAKDSNDLSETFGYLKDFSKSLMRKSNQVSINPMQYVEKTIVAYKNPGHNFTSPYAVSNYSGMMFNFYC